MTLKASRVAHSAPPLHSNHAPPSNCSAARDCRWSAQPPHPPASSHLAEAVPRGQGKEHPAGGGAPASAGQPGGGLCAGSHVPGCWLLNNAPCRRFVGCPPHHSTPHLQPCHDRRSSSRMRRTRARPTGSRGEVCFCVCLCVFACACACVCVSVCARMATTYHTTPHHITSHRTIPRRHFSSPGHSLLLRHPAAHRVHHQAPARGQPDRRQGRAQPGEAVALPPGGLLLLLLLPLLMASLLMVRQAARRRATWKGCSSSARWAGGPAAVALPAPAASGAAGGCRRLAHGCMLLLQQPLPRAPTAHHP